MRGENFVEVQLERSSCRQCMHTEKAEDVLLDEKPMNPTPYTLNIPVLERVPSSDNS